MSIGLKCSQAVANEIGEHSYLTIDITSVLGLCRCEIREQFSATDCVFQGEAHALDSVFYVIL